MNCKLPWAVWIVAGLFLLGGSALSGPEQESAPEVASTVFVVRHAEAIAGEQGGRDPGLSDVGQLRANQLAAVLERSKVTHLFASEYRRTQETLAPLAAANEIEVRTLAAGQGDELRSALDGLPSGSVAVVCGHSNTVPALFNALGGEASGLEEHPRYGLILGHDDYSRLFVVMKSTDSGCAPMTLELSYGE